MNSTKSTLTTNHAHYSTHATLKSDISRRYHSYLLRIWRENETLPWRAQLENPHTSEVIGFATLDMLTEFLNSQLSTEERQAA